MISRTAMAARSTALLLATVAALTLAPAGALASAHRGMHTRTEKTKAHAHRRHAPLVRGGGSGNGSSCMRGVCFTGDPFYLEAGQCTWYAAGRRPDLNGIVHGNAGEWLAEARGHVRRDRRLAAEHRRRL
jgi:hypothetical protein